MEILQILALPAIGVCVATLGTLVGLGGGFILVPILLMIFPNASPSTISSISLTVVFLNAASATIGNYRAKVIDFKTTGLLAIGAIPAAAVGALVSDQVSRTTFDLSMGIMLVLGSVYVVWRGYRANAARAEDIHYPNRHITERMGRIHQFYVSTITAAGLSPASGFISSFFGIGGGVINVPAMTFILKMPTRVIAPTAMLLLVLTSSSSLITRILTHQFEDGWEAAALLGIGALIGAQIGIYLSSRVNQKLILILLAVSMALVGLRQVVLGI
tara:strand:+ start:112 stop:930 length:819 start_codon:yes stop_codon:yes gene_type:complete